MVVVHVLLLLLLTLSHPAHGFFSQVGSRDRRALLRLNAGKAEGGVILGLNKYSHDAAVCVIEVGVDGRMDGERERGRDG